MERDNAKIQRFKTKMKRTMILNRGLDGGKAPTRGHSQQPMDRKKMDRDSTKRKVDEDAKTEEGSVPRKAISN